MLRNIVRRIGVLLILAALVLMVVFAMLGRFSVWPLVTLILHPPYLQAILAGVLGLGLLILMLWDVPIWQASGVWKRKDRLTLENAARQTLAQIIGGAILIAGLFFTWANLKITQEIATQNQEITREGQITDRFTKAIAQLGEQGPEKLAVRLGGIYALERITKESKKDHWPIMEVLTAYVRETAPWPPKPPKDAQPLKGNQSPREEPSTTQEHQPPRPTTDIQAILTVLGRRIYTYENGEALRLHLANTDLRGASLWEAKLQGVRFWGAQLQEADLTGAQLQGALLLDAGLQGALLWGAQLQGADLRRAQLQGAILGDAQLQEAILGDAGLQGALLLDAGLQGANLRGAQLQGADLRRAQLEGARNLTVEQLSTVKTLYQAHLDPPLLEQIQQQYPHLLEKSNF
jgi:hypothetical protein